MDQFREFIQEFGPQHFAVAAPIHLLLSTAGMWFTVNQLQKQPEKVPVWRCALCAALLYAVACGGAALLIFPAPIVLIFALLAWLAASVAIVRVMFQLPDGGAGILFMYLVVLAAIHSLVKAAMG